METPETCTRVAFHKQFKTCDQTPFLKQHRLLQHAKISSNTTTTPLCKGGGLLQICILASILLVHPQTTATSLKQPSFHVQMFIFSRRKWSIHSLLCYPFSYGHLSTTEKSHSQVHPTCRTTTQQWALENGVYKTPLFYCVVPENIHNPPHGWSMEIPRAQGVKR